MALQPLEPAVDVGAAEREHIPVVQPFSRLAAPHHEVQEAPTPLVDVRLIGRPTQPALPPRGCVSSAIVGARAVGARRLDRVFRPDFERLVGATHQLGTDAELTRYMKGYPERSEFTDLTLTERHGLVVVRSGAPGRLHVGDDSLWQRAMKDGAAESEPAIDSSTRTVTVRYAVALRPGEGARPVGVLEGVYTLDRVGSLLTGIALGDSAYLQLVDRRGNLVYGPADAALRQGPRGEALY